MQQGSIAGERSLSPDRSPTVHTTAGPDWGVRRTRPGPTSCDRRPCTHSPCKEGTPMSTITVSDGTEIYFKDWGEGPVVTFSHGWPLSADQWDGQMMFLNQHGFRTIAHDRRGHGRSSQTSSGNNMDTYADDLAELLEALDLRDVTVVAHSPGCGEVARYIGLHGTARVAKAALISGVPPHLAPTASDPVGLP